MSYNTVNALMKAIADAIRAKDGTSAVIAHQDFPDRIAAIQSGVALEDVVQRKLSGDIVIDGPWTSGGTNDAYIFTRMFKGDKNITGITLTPSGYVEIGESAFESCSNLVNFNIPRTYSIDKNAFKFCSALEHVDISVSCTINSGAFYGSGLKTLTLRSSSRSTLSSTDALPSGITAIYVPSSLVSSYQSATNWSSFASKIQAIT